MNSAEKTLLRYNYLLSVTGDQQGDFSKTSGTWANQVRLLQLQWQMLSATMGQAFIAGLTPVVTALNKLIAKLQVAATAFKNFVLAVTGANLGGASGAVQNAVSGLSDSSNTLSGLSDASDSAANGLSDASNSAKTLKKTLSVLPFDELNQLQDHTSSSSGRSGSDNDGLGDLVNDIGSLGDLTVPDAVSNYASRLAQALKNQNWELAGLIIAEKLNNAMAKLDSAIKWSKIKDTATRICNGITGTINSVIKHFNWELLGQLIGDGLTDAVKIANLLIGQNGFDFEGLGDGLSQAFRRFIETVPWTEFGNMLGNFFMIPWRIFSGFVKNMATPDAITGLTGFQELGIAFGQAINGIFERIDLSQIGTAVATLFNGISDALASAADTIKWDEIANNVSSGINSFINTVDWAGNGEKISKFLVDMLNSLKDAVGDVDWEALGKGIGDFLGSIDWLTIFTDVVNVLWTTLSGLLSGFLSTNFGKGLVAALAGVTVVSKLMSKVPTVLGPAIKTALLGSVMSSGAGAALAEKVGTIFGTGLIPKALTGLGTMLSSVVSFITTTLIPGIGVVIASTPALLFVGIGLAIVAIIAFLNSELGKKFINGVGKKIKELAGWFGEKFSAIGEHVSNAWDTVKSKTSSVWQSVTGTVKGAVTTVASSAKDKIGAAASAVKDKWSAIKTSTSDTWGNIKSTIGNKLSNAKDNVVKNATAIKSSMQSKFTSALTVAKEKFNSIKEKITSPMRKTKEFVTNAIQTIKKAFNFTAQFKLKLPHISVDGGEAPWGIGGAGRLPSFNVRWYRNGGFIGGELWGMNETGNPEMVGRMGNGKTAVANNAIIEKAISSAVEQAMTNVMMRYASSTNNRSDDYVTVNVDLDGDTIARVLTKAQKRRNGRLSPSY